MIRPLLLGLVALALSGCAATRTYVSDRYDDDLDAPEPPADRVVYEVFLLGNTADGDPEAAEPVFRALAQELDRAGEQSAVVFLGDLLPDGMPDSLAAGFAEADARLGALAETVAGYDGRVLALPGDRDWRQGEDGVERLEAVLEAKLDRGDVVAPGDARPGPVVLELADDLVLVVLDTAWWLEEDERPGGEAGRFEGDVGAYEVENPYEVVLALESVFREYDDANVLVVGHHPIKSLGAYGGHFPLRRHLLPPVLGSVYPLYRTFVGAGQDLASPAYRAMRQALDRVFRAYDGVVYAASHDRSLQVFPVEESIRRTQYYLVSGSAAEGEPVATGRGAAFTSSDRGFLRLRYLDGGAAWLDVLRVDPETAEAEVAYRYRLRDTRAEAVDPEVPDFDPGALPSYEGQTVTAAINPDYRAGALKRLLLGAGYRNAWAAEVPFPVLDMNLGGGLTPVQRGGGMQTVSLRLEDAEGYTYVLRLLRKEPGRTLPEELQRSVIADIIQELTSATIPWGALTAASLAEAAGLYHTDPQLVYVPDDPRLGIYREEFGGRLALFEIRADEDMSAFDRFGNSDNVKSTPSMVEDVEDDQDHRVDQRFFLRNRLLDMLMSDWDRHADQWRWASLEPYQLDPSLTGEARTKGKIYRPIPRDRDFAFYRLGGLVPFVASRVEPKLQSFNRGYGNLKGLTTSGIPLDRRFTNALTREDWIAEARSLQAALTDEVVEAAFRRWPEAVFAEYGPAAIETLKERLARLPEVAGTVYDFYAEVVDVVGTNKRERFEVTRHDGGHTDVVVYDTNREGERQAELYRRRFDPHETREIRLYGLGAGDFFVVDGGRNAAIRLRIIGGAGEDTFRNPSGGGGIALYDTEAGNVVEGRGGARVYFSDEPANNAYDPSDYKHGLMAVYPTAGYNRTDGALLGLGYTTSRPGFRRYPWAAIHTVEGTVATMTGGLRGRYRGQFFDVLGRDYDAEVSLSGSTPRYVRTFYGFGNDTGDGGQPSDFFHVDITTATGHVSLIRSVEEAIQAEIGGGASFYEVKEDSLRFIGTPAAMLPASAFEPQAFAEAFLRLTLQRVDVAANPRQGFRFTARGGVHGGVTEAAPTFGTLGADLAFYVSPSLYPQLTIAARAGAGHNVGDFPFFAAQTLGGETNLRGLVRQRYSGRTAAYQNAEVRLKLFDALGYLLPSDVGLLAFVDNGRVWVDGDDGSLTEGWHQGYGGGLWLSTLDRFVFTGTVASGDDGVLVNVGLHFLY